MCIEKTPWEQVVDFHGSISADIALGYRIAQIAAREMGIKPNNDSELVIKSKILSGAVDAFQIMNHVTLGRGTLLIEDSGDHTYYFHYTGTESILCVEISQAAVQRVVDSKLFNNNREKQNKALQAIEFLLALAEADFCTLTWQDGQISPIRN